MTLKELVMKVDFDSLIRKSGKIDIWITSTPSVNDILRGMEPDRDYRGKATVTTSILSFIVSLVRR